VDCGFNVFDHLELNQPLQETAFQLRFCEAHSRVVCESAYIIFPYIDIQRIPLHRDRRYRIQRPRPGYLRDHDFHRIQQRCPLISRITQPSGHR
jgi:hypothetical protein